MQIADMATEIEAARLMVYNAARLKEEGKPFTKSAAMAKLFCSRVANDVTRGAIELCGGVGYVSCATILCLHDQANANSDYRQEKLAVRLLFFT